MEKKAKRREKLSLIVKIMKGNWRYFAICVAAMAFNVCLSYISPRVVGSTVDSVIGELPFDLPAFIVKWIDGIGGREFLLSHLYICGAAVFVIALFTAVFHYIRSYMGAVLAEKLSYKLRKQLFDHIQRLPFSWHKSVKTGDIMQRCSSDVDTFCRFVSLQFTDIIRIVMMLIIVYVLMFALNVKMALVCLFFAPVIVIYSGAFYSKIAKRFKKADEEEGKLHSVAQENFTGIRVVKAFGRERAEYEKFSTVNNAYSDLWVRTGRLMSLYWSIGDFISWLQTAVILIYGTVLTVNGEMSPGNIIIFVMYGGLLSWPMHRLGRTLGEMSKAGVSIDRINEILLVEPEVQKPGELRPQIKGNIKFDHVSFTYDEGEVLHDISFEIKAGQTVAILGGTGSGKSTLIHLLNRLYDLGPGQGSISIDGIDIRDIDARYLRRNIAMVLQEPFLFSDTIDSNLRLAAPNAGEAELLRAARDAYIHESIVRFPQGYKTVVGEKGVTLSGGQRQRVAIARALAENAPILVFDDSFSAVDMQTDSKIRAALKIRRKNVTAVIISHRISTLMDADRIIVLSAGRIAESGTHDELVEKGGIYSQVFGIQSLFEEEIEAEVKSNG